MQNICPRCALILRRHATGIAAPTLVSQLNQTSWCDPRHSSGGLSELRFRLQGVDTDLTRRSILNWKLPLAVYSWMTLVHAVPQTGGDTRCVRTARLVRGPAPDDDVIIRQLCRVQLCCGWR